MSYGSADHLTRKPQEEEKNNGDDSNGDDIKFDLPEDSLFTKTDYLEMYHLATKEVPYEILDQLSKRDKLSTTELAELTNREGNKLHYYLRELKRKALVKNRRDPNTGTEETYSYYTLTDLGNTVLTHGPKKGMKILAEQEAEISEKYTP